ncbi:hypothetical protein [Roseiconus lacunae]|uniref:Uncharacterized protein n=1 Tax=Roseiconus lacunae TaxID=2605694 RepID=A0ABT7PLH4_9BACT|nr:hypothetical protein [Roseiconus lacunae]MDM4017320.1 hypothetical protein [Roseiconus lacunae]WRQ48768.1 hypothetical protein U8335_17570 [Stieleria sp. HD01]
MQASSNENNLTNELPSHVNAVDAIRDVEDWTVMTDLLSDQSRNDYAAWLDDELRSMEQTLEQFVSDRSKYAGRR